MRFRTRVFVLYFAPVALLLAVSFWAIQSLVQATVRDGLRTTLRENQLSMARLRSRSDLENSRFLKVAGENAALKAGMQLLLSAPANVAARATVEDQLGELCERMGFDLLMVANPNGVPIAGVIRAGAGQNTGIVPMPQQLPQSIRPGLEVFSGKIYQLATVPVDQGEENIGSLSVGEVFDVSQFNTPTVLLHNGEVVESSVPGVSASGATRALKVCAGKDECDLHLAGANYVSLPMQNVAFGNGYELRSLQNVDSASAPVQHILHRLFLFAGTCTLLFALILSFFASRTVVHPITLLISHLRRSESTGLLAEFNEQTGGIPEFRDLSASFNRAALAIRDARESLHRAYVEFVGSLANALDARDPYTAGHSRRVSALSCATAAEMGLPEEDIEQLRVGALLHDIGKIGVADTILSKVGRLTPEEMASIKLHPEIGRRILEGVNGFSPYLPAVELHHENWDGSGYPRGQQGEEIPIVARIIHVVDAYDAMTTDRPYRSGMSHHRALSILQECAGTQFDPEVVAAFIKVAPRPESWEPETALCEMA